MFIIFRLLKAILSVTGYLLTFVLLVFAFFPLDVQAKDNLSLNQIFNCDENFVLSDQDVNSYNEVLDNYQNKANFNTGLNDTIFSLFTKFDDSYDVFGMKALFNFSYCSVQIDDSEYVEQLNSVFTAEMENYHFGRPTELKNGFSRSVIDFMNAASSVNAIKDFLNIDPTNQNLVLAKTSYCQTPIHKSKYYVITKEGTNVYMYYVQFSADEEATIQYMFNNLSSTAASVKSGIFCK